MKKNLPRFMIMLTLAAIVCLPSLASADYIKTGRKMALSISGNLPDLG